MPGKSAVVVLSAIMTMLAMAGWAVGAGAATRDVDVRDDEYVDSVSSTSTTTITAGDTVQWTWSGSNPHTVDNNGGTETFSSGAPKTTGSFSHTFNVAGTYNYICGIHGTAMQGMVIVQAAQEPTSTSTPQATNTPVPEATDTVAAGSTATNTPAATSTPITAAPASASATPAAGAALPATGDGGRAGGPPSLSGPLSLAAAGALILVAAAFVRRRRPS